MAHLEKKLSVGQSVRQSRACGMSRPYIAPKYSTGALVGGLLWDILVTGVQSANSGQVPARRQGARFITAAHCGSDRNGARCSEPVNSLTPSLGGLHFFPPAASFCLPLYSGKANRWRGWASVTLSVSEGWSKPFGEAHVSLPQRNLAIRGRASRRLRLTLCVSRRDEK